MPAAPLTVSGLLAITTAVGAVGLAFSPDPFAADSAALTSAGLILLGLVALSGVLLARGRWSRPVSALIVAAWVAVGSVQTSPIGLATVILAAAVLVGVLGPWLGRWLRHLASADGPPAEAVTALLVLVATPAALGLALGAGVPIAAWAWAGWSVGLALAIARVVPGALATARFLHPVLAVGAAFLLPLPAGAVVLAAASSVTLLVWRRSVRVAIAPVLPVVGSAVRFPPELTPRPVLEAAGIDDTGQRLSS